MPIHDWNRVTAGIFHDFHHDWITMLKRALNAGLLPAGYYALAEQIAGGFGPDVLTLDLGPPSPPSTTASSAAATALVLATAPPKVRFTAASERDLAARRRHRVAIRHTSDHRVVAVVEIVSPGNKASRHALRSFVDKALELLEAGVHLLVIDLWPPGPRDPQGIHGALWSEIEDGPFELPPDKPLTLAAYSAGDLKRAFVEPLAVGEVLPDMPLFLTPEAYVAVPLEGTYRSAWEGVPAFWRQALEPGPG